MPLPVTEIISHDFSLQLPPSFHNDASHLHFGVILHAWCELPGYGPLGTSAPHTGETGEPAGS